MALLPRPGGTTFRREATLSSAVRVGPKAHGGDVTDLGLAGGAATLRRLQAGVAAMILGGQELAGLDGGGATREGKNSAVPKDQA